MALDFYPWQEGQVIKAADLNKLVESIQDGTVFLNTTYISEQLSSTSTRLNGIEDRVSFLEGQQGLLNIREQFVMVLGQTLVNLSQTPVLDGELLFLNGLSLSKSGVPVGFVGDYSLAGSTVTFNTELSSQIVAGDILVAMYRYEA